MFGDSLKTENDELLQKLVGWYTKFPDFYEVDEAYKLYGELKAHLTKLKREIERIEEQISIEVDKPRSNEAKQKKLTATSELKDQQAEIQAQLDVQETIIKRLEFRKVMFQTSTHAIKMKFDL